MTEDAIPQTSVYGMAKPPRRKPCFYWVMESEIRRGFRYGVLQSIWRCLEMLTGNLRPLRDSHDRPLYSKQFCDMEFICVPEPDGQYKALAEVAIKKRNRSN